MGFERYGVPCLFEGKGKLKSVIMKECNGGRKMEREEEGEMGIMQCKECEEKEGMNEGKQGRSKVKN